MRPSRKKTWLQPLPYFGIYVKRLDAADKMFRELLNGRRDFEPWADPTFWWHWPEDKKPKA